MILLLMKYKTSDYRVISFTQSDKPNKKYYATIENKDGDRHKIYFGAIKHDGTPYEQYKDTTPLQLYTEFNHYDRYRMNRYIRRHEPFDFNYITPNILSLIYLWSD